MHNPTYTADPFPTIPKRLSFPLRLIPAFIHDTALVTSLNKIFFRERVEGELEFLKSKVIQISIDDIGIRYMFSMQENRCIPVDRDQQPDLYLNGTLYDYLLLASRKEDTDALFFSRRLKMQGDTELGLHVKNFLDGLDMESHKIPAYLETVLKKSLPLYERLFG